MEQKLRRRFLGKIGNKVSDFENRAEMDFEKKHLAAYLKGKEYFIVGYEGEWKQPIYAEVKQEFYWE